MGDSDNKYLDVFPQWLRNLADDAELLGKVVAQADAPEAVRELAASGVNYLFRSLDLIPDGIDDLGYLDDAFVLRVAAEGAAREELNTLPEDVRERLVQLAQDADTIREFLGEDYARLQSYVEGLGKSAARGRSVQDIVSDSGTQSDFLSDLGSFARQYETPSFAREAKNLVKLRAFFNAKLPK